jgi:hypothetical protein
MASCSYRAFIFWRTAMPRPQKPFFTRRRNDSKTFLFSINPASGLPRKACLGWWRRSFQGFPDALAQYRNPKTSPRLMPALSPLSNTLTRRRGRTTPGAFPRKTLRSEVGPKNLQTLRPVPGPASERAREQNPKRKRIQATQLLQIVKRSYNPMTKSSPGNASGFIF